VRIKRIGLIVVAGLLLLILVLPEMALAAGPEISNVQVPDVSFASATITWTTNNYSDSRVNYGTDRPKNVTTWEYVHDPAQVTHHSIHLEGLNPGETYYFEVVSKDASGTATDNNGDEYYSFKTLAWYSISLSPISGSCGEEIAVTATVAAPGTYHISWDTLTNHKQTFPASTAGVYEVAFYLGQATKGSHKVYLVDSTDAKKAEANFEVFPSAEIDPVKGPVGTVVTLSGCGFAAAQQIQVKFKDAVIQTTQTTGNGTWPTTISYTIPDTPGGDYDFRIEVGGAAWVSRGFEVTPRITAPSSGAVGRTIEIKGTGFRSNERDIEVTFSNPDGEVVVKENIPADVNGSWTALVNIPALEGGSYTVDASGRQTIARDVDDATIVVGAGIFVDPPGSHYVGDTITVKGGGFATLETGIRVSFEGTSVASGITAYRDGTWEYTFDLPASFYGSHTVSASGDITRSAVTATLSIQARILEISPDEGAPGDLVRLTGDGFGSSEQLRVSIGGVAASANMTSQSNGNVVVSFPVPKGSSEGTQLLMASDGSGATDDDYFTVTKKTLSTTPLPISPKDSTLRSGEVTFRWQGVTGGTGYTYKLEIYMRGTNTTTGYVNIWSKPGIAESSYALNSTGEALDEPGTYYWRVKIVDDYDNEGAWSDYVEFRVSPIPPWVWVVIGLVVLIVLMVVAYRETKFRVTD